MEERKEQVEVEVEVEEQAKKKVLIVDEDIEIAKILEEGRNQIMSQTASVDEVEKESTVEDGKVRTVDGKVVDRHKAGFLLRQHPEHKKFYGASDGTVYHRSADGQLRKVSDPKPLSKKARKRAEQKMRRRDV